MTKISLQILIQSFSAEISKESQIFVMTVGCRGVMAVISHSAAVLVTSGHV